jgi:hypothetical protein
MKTNIFKIASIMLILAISFSACRKEEMLSKVGHYIEVSPIKGNTKINFIDNERLVLSQNLTMEEKYHTHFEYKYKNHKKSIKLTWLDASLGNSNYFYFKYKNKNKFEMGSLYIEPAVAIGPPTIMIFEKE